MVHMSIRIVSNSLYDRFAKQPTWSSASQPKAPQGPTGTGFVWDASHATWRNMFIFCQIGNLVGNQRSPKSPKFNPPNGGSWKGEHIKTEVVFYPGTMSNVCMCEAQRLTPLVQVCFVCYQKSHSGWWNPSIRPFCNFWTSEPCWLYHCIRTPVVSDIRRYGWYYISDIQISISIP